MQVSKIAAVLAFSTVFAGAAIADVRDGSFVANDGQTYSAPAYANASSVSRSDVQSQATQAVRANIQNPIVAGGLGGNVQTAAPVAANVSREAVRAQASEAVRMSIKDPITASGLGA